MSGAQEIFLGLHPRKSERYQMDRVDFGGFGIGRCWLGSTVLSLKKSPNHVQMQKLLPLEALIVRSHSETYLNRLLNSKLLGCNLLRVK